MKILLTTDTWSPAVNGVVRSVELLYKELLALGHDVRVLTLSGTSHSYQEGNIIYLGSLNADKVYPGVRVGLRLLSHWLDVLEEWKPDIIHSQNESSTFIPATRIAKHCNCPIVHTYHTLWEDYFTLYVLPSEKLSRATVERLTRIVAERCTTIIAPTDKIRALLEDYGVDCNIATVPTGIDRSIFHPAEDGGAERAAMRKELGIPEDAPVLVMIGRLAAEKNNTEVLRLMSEQPSEKRPWLVFVGDGPDRTNLEKFTKKLDLENTVRFAGMVKPDEVPRWYRFGDAFVCASITETQGLTYFEALACGTPVICKESECMKDIIINGENGWQWNTDEEFSTALEQFCTNTDLRKTLSQNALKTAEPYSSKHFAQQVVEVYGQAIKNPKLLKKDNIISDIQKSVSELFE